MKIKPRKIAKNFNKPGLKKRYELTITQTDIFRGWKDFKFRSGVNGSFYSFLYIYLLDWIAIQY